MAHRSPFDDHSFSDPLQSHQATQATTLTTTPSQTQANDAQNPQPQSQNPLQRPHESSSTSSSSASSIREQNIDKFATLFSPSTPRGSPVTFPPPTLPDEGTAFDQATHVKSHTNAHHRTESTSSEQSDFGMFVSVPSFEDPLSAPVDMTKFEEHGLQQPPAAETPSTATAAAYLTVSLPTADSIGETSATTPRFTLPPPAARGRPASRASSSSASSTSRSTRVSTGQLNPTLSFFDQFAQDARERSSATRSLLLDELLLHQDDPLYFLKEQKAETVSQIDVTTSSSEGLLSPLIPLPASTSTPPLVSSDPPNQPLPPSTLSPSPAMSSSPQPSHPQSLLDLDLNADLDHDYFRVPPPQANLTTTFKPTNPSTKIHPHLARSPPLRSSSIPVPVPTLAPPVSSPEGAMRLESEHHSRSPPAAAHLIDISHHLSASGAGMDDSPDMSAQHHDLEDGTSSSPSSTSSSRLSLPTRSSSYHSLSGSLSALPGKWMSTLLRGAQPPPTTPALESIFSSGSEASGSTAPASDSTHSHSPPHPPHDPVLTRRKSTSTSTSSQPRRRPTQSHPEQRQQPTFTHTSAFAPPPNTASTLLSGVSHGASPFAPNVYVPPSGAPGFKGERYMWDKGFSDELEAEAEQERGREGHGHGAGDGNGRDLRTGHVKAKTVPGVGKENNHSERDDFGESSSRSASNSGWGSGFGFSFGSVRAGKGKVSPGSGSNSASTSSPGKASTSPSNGNTNGRTRTSSAHSEELSEGSRNAHTHAHERARTTPVDTSAVGTQPLNADNASDRRHGDFSGEVVRQTGVGATRRPVGPGERNIRRNVDVDEFEGGGKDGIGAFIERKSGNVELKGRKAVTTPVLTPELAGMIRPHLPALSRLPRSWTLIYSLDQDGISLNTLYARCEAHVTRRPAPGEVLMNNSAMLIVMQDADGGVFGVWLAEGVRLNKGGKGYFGGGESFLWKYREDNLKVFKSTGKNNYIGLCEPEYISFGGGDGHYGLYLDDTLFDGSSAPCPTFDNEPLCSPGPRKGASVTFECVGLEVWGMGT